MQLRARRPGACRRPASRRRARSGIACGADGARQPHRRAGRLPGRHVGEADDAGARRRSRAAARPGSAPAPRRWPTGGRRMRTAAGLRCSAASRSPRVCDAVLQLDRGDAVEHRLLERRRRLRERADALGVRPSAPAPAAPGLRCALTAQRRPRAIATASRTAAPASSPRRRRLVRRSARRSRSASATPASRKARSVALSSRAGLASSTRAGEPARRGRGRTARGRRRPRAVRRRRGGGAPGWPARSSSSQPRSRGHSRISASCATSAEPSPSVTRRASASRSSSASTPSGEAPCRHELGARPRAGASPRCPRRARSGAGRRCARALAASAGSASTTASAVRAIADGDAAAGAVALDGQRAAVAPLPGRAQRVRQQRQRAGLGGDVAQDQLDQARLELAGRRAAPAPSTARSSSSSVIAPSSTWLRGDRGGEARVRAEAPVDVGAQADRDGARAGASSASTKAARRAGVVAQR